MIIKPAWTALSAPQRTMLLHAVSALFRRLRALLPVRWPAFFSWTLRGYSRLTQPARAVPSNVSKDFVDLPGQLLELRENISRDIMASLG